MSTRNLFLETHKAQMQKLETLNHETRELMKAREMKKQ